MFSQLKKFLSTLALLPCALSVENVLADYAVVVSSKSGKALSLAQRVIDSVPDGYIVSVDELNNLEGDIDLLVPFGDKATNQVIKSDHLSEVPSLSLFSSRSYQPNSAQESAIYRSVDLTTQVESLRKLLAKDRISIGLFYSESTQYIEEEAKEIDIDGVSIHRSILDPGSNPAKQIEPFIRRHRLDAFIVVPSSDIYTSHSLSATLYKLFNFRVAASTYSPKLLRDGAGGVVSAHITVEDILIKANQEIQSFLDSNTFTQIKDIQPEPRISLNDRMAKIMGLAVETIQAEQGGDND